MLLSVREIYIRYITFDLEAYQQNNNTRTVLYKMKSYIYTILYFDAKHSHNTDQHKRAIHIFYWETVTWNTKLSYMLHLHGRHAAVSNPIKIIQLYIQKYSSMK